MYGRNYSESSSSSSSSNSSYGGRPVIGGGVGMTPLVYTQPAPVTMIGSGIGGGVSMAPPIMGAPQPPMGTGFGAVPRTAPIGAGVTPNVQPMGPYGGQYPQPPMQQPYGQQPVPGQYPGSQPYPPNQQYGAYQTGGQPYQIGAGAAPNVSPYPPPPPPNQPYQGYPRNY